MAERTVKRRNRPNRYSDDLLLDAAAGVFHERGFHEASMVEIAQRAGATKPTLYARFGSKEALYDRALERVAESLTAEMTAAYKGVEAETPEEATFGPVMTFFTWVRSNRVGFHLLFAPDQGAPTGLDHGDRAQNALTEMITGANAEFLRGRNLRPGRATGLLAAYFVGVMVHGARWAVEHDALETLNVPDFSARFILSGLHGVSPEAISALTPRKRVA
jgi:AcrR family transcriptional regulator